MSTIDPSPSKHQTSDFSREILMDGGRRIRHRVVERPVRPPIKSESSYLLVHTYLLVHNIINNIMYLSTATSTTYLTTHSRAIEATDD